MMRLRLSILKEVGGNLLSFMQLKRGRGLGRGNKVKKGVHRPPQGKMLSARTL